MISAKTRRGWTVSWSIAVPTVVGATLGMWLDQMLYEEVYWTLTMLSVGVALGCLIAWHWMRRESGHD